MREEAVGVLAAKNFTAMKILGAKALRAAARSVHFTARARGYGTR
jgi:hypothetical protein